METVKLNLKRVPVLSYRVVSIEDKTLGVFDSYEEASKFAIGCGQTAKIQKVEKWVKINV